MSSFPSHSRIWTVCPDDAIRNFLKYNSITADMVTQDVPCAPMSSEGNGQPDGAHCPEEENLSKPNEDHNVDCEKTYGSTIGRLGVSIDDLPYDEKITEMCRLLKAFDVEKYNYTRGSYFINLRTKEDPDFDFICADST